MLTVRVNGVEAYAATADLSQAGLLRALEHAEALARQIARYNLLDLREPPVTSARHDHSSPNFDQPVPNLADCLGLLAAESASVPKDSRLVDWQASLGLSLVEQTSLNSAGAELRHAQRFLFPGLGVTASDGQDSQSRSLGRWGYSVPAAAAAPRRPPAGDGPHSRRRAQLRRHQLRQGR